MSAPRKAAPLSVAPTQAQGGWPTCRSFSRAAKFETDTSMHPGAHQAVFYRSVVA